MRAPAVVIALSLGVLGCRGATVTPPFPQATAPPTTLVSTSTTTPAIAATTTTVAGPVRFASPYARLGSARELAADLTEAEAIVFDAAKPAPDRARAARRQQHRIRQLVDTPTWDAEVLAATPAARRDALRRNVEAGRMLLAMFRVFPDVLPSWEIRDPAPAADLVRFYKEAQAALGVDWTYLAAINFVETKMGRIRGLSTAGARGPMQFLPSSWSAFGAGGDIDDDRDSIFAAARHLLSSGGKPFDIRKALYGYNHSDKYVTAVLDYAAVLQAEPDAYVGYHAWHVFYRTTQGDFLLAQGYKEATKIPVADYAARPVATVPE